MNQIKRTDCTIGVYLKLTKNGFSCWEDVAEFTRAELRQVIPSIGIRDIEEIGTCLNRYGLNWRPSEVMD